ncbi:hypothetical protein G6F42_026232 [Rhizopus arrhizus]|nr:hypothetical protein G6F42_026232 [Rhizopus arrhizus]
MTKEKQQELIRQLEEKEKALEAQVNDKENEIRKLYKTIEEDKTDLEDIGHLCEDYRISIDQNEIMLAELQKTLKEKTRLLDEEKRLKEQTEENYEKTKKKWDKISQGDNPAEQQLIDECEELRTQDWRLDNEDVQLAVNHLVQMMSKTSICKPPPPSNSS